MLDFLTSLIINEIGFILPRILAFGPLSVRHCVLMQLNYPAFLGSYLMNAINKYILGVEGGGVPTGEALS